MMLERRVPSRTTLLIAGGVLLGIIALALHPHVSGHPNGRAALHEMVALGARDRLVHGTLMLLLGALLTGLTTYAFRRGLTRRPIAAGLVAFAVGIGGLFAAGLIDGFILPDIVARFVSASPATQDAAVVTLTALAIGVNACTSFAIVAMAIAIVAWSLDLARSPGESRPTAIAGFAAAAISVAVLAAGGHPITPHALMAMFAAQGAWYVWIAVVSPREGSTIA